MPSLKLLKQPGNNYPLICNLYFCPERWVNIATPYYGSPNVSALTMNTPAGDSNPASLYGLYYVPGSEEIEGEGSGSGHEKSISFFMPSDTASITEWLHSVVDDRHVVAYKDQTHGWKIMGDKDNGCRLSYKYDNSEGRRGYTFTFSWENHQLSRHLTSGAVDEVPIEELHLEGIGYWIIGDDFVVQ